MIARPFPASRSEVSRPRHLALGTAGLWAAAPAVAAGASDVELFTTHSTGVALAFMLSVTAIKITAFVIGYLIVKLGHDTLVRGVTGEVDFGFSGSGVKAKLKAASPGGLFILAGAAIIVWGLVVEKPMRVAITPGSPAGSEGPRSDARPPRPVPE